MKNKLKFIIAILVVFFILIFLASFYKKVDPINFDGKDWQDLLNNRNNNYPIVFMHGIAGGLVDWQKAIEAITSRNYVEIYFQTPEKIFHNYGFKKPKDWIFNVSYYVPDPIYESLNGNLDVYTKRLGLIIDLIKHISKKRKVIIVAHSMGGLIARNYMALNDKNWHSVHKILTVGTPNDGVAITTSLVGQLKDLKRGSPFLINLENNWQKYKDANKKWGVIGAVDTKFWNSYKNPQFTDAGGIGFIEIASAIPYGEWEDAVNNWQIPVYNTKNFDFRLAVSAQHSQLLFHPATLKGLFWAVE